MRPFTAFAATLLLAACTDAPSGPDAAPADAPVVASATTVASGQDRPSGLAIRNSRIVWTNEGDRRDDATGTVMQCTTLDCADGPELLFENLGRPMRPTLVGNRLLFLGAFGITGGGDLVSWSVMSAPLNGSEMPWPVLWPDGWREIASYTVAGSAVYMGSASDWDAIVAVCDAQGCPGSGTMFDLAAEGLAGTSALARDDASGDLFVAEPYSAEIVRIGPSGDPESFASAQIAVFELTVDDGDVFWGTSVGDDFSDTPEIEVNNYVARQPVDGGPMVRLAEAAAVTSIAVDGDWVYFGDASGRIARVHRDGGDAQELETGYSRPRGLTVHQGHLYWTDQVRDGGVYRLELPQE